MVAKPWWKRKNENNLAANLLLISIAENLAANLGVDIAANLSVYLKPGQFWCRKRPTQVRLRSL